MAPPSGVSVFVVAEEHPDLQLHGVEWLGSDALAAPSPERMKERVENLSRLARLRGVSITALMDFPAPISCSL